MKGAACASMMCGLPREDFCKCERLMTVPVKAGASRSPRRPTLAGGVALRDDWRALTTAPPRADNERLVDRLVRGDLG
jgi:hypothetical protein